ncbi:MAG: pyridoxal phosphate-dependent aminotransferase [Spirochaetota bacterium]
MSVSTAIRELMSRSSWIRRMFDEGLQLKQVHGERVCDFSLGNPNLEPPGRFTAALTEILQDPSPGKHRYMPNAGYPEVRRSVAEGVSREQETDLDADHLIMTCGAGGGLNVALKTILNPGDRVLAPAPYFTEYGSYAANHGGVLETVPGRDDFLPDMEALAARVTERTAAVIINSPNNPSGRIFPERTVGELGEMLERRCREVGRTVYLISDEPYRKIVFDGNRVPPVFPFYRNSMVVSSYSKDLSIPGERIGWLAVNPAADHARELVDGFILCNRILGFVNAPALMQRAVQRLQGKSVDVSLYQRKRDLLCDGLQELGYRFFRPQGAFYVLPEAPGGDDAAFVRELADQLILAVPARGFGAPGRFRLAFCVEDRVIEQSMRGFAAAMEKQKP